MSEAGFDYTAAYDGIEDGIAAYAEDVSRVATSVFDKSREDARDDAREALAASAQLADVHSALIENPRLLKVLRTACKPPLTRDKVAGMANMRPYKIAGLEDDGQRIRSKTKSGRVLAPASTPARKAKRVQDLDRISSVIAAFLDTDLAPWLADSRPPTKEEASRWVELVADRAACRSDFWGISSPFDSEAHLRFERWLRERGYEPWPPCDGCEFGGRGGTQEGCTLSACPLEESEPDPGTYRNLYSCEMDPDFDYIVYPREGARPLGVSCVVYPDPANALRHARKSAEKLAASAGGRMLPVLAVSGLLDASLIGKMEEFGVAVVWLHDLGQLEQLGI